MKWVKNCVVFVLKHSWLNWLIKLLFSFTFIGLGFGLTFGLENYWYLLFAIFGFSALVTFVFKSKNWKYYKQNHGILAVTKEIYYDRKNKKSQESQ